MSDGPITLEDCQRFADSQGFELSNFADKIIARTNMNGGYCPCVSAKEREEHPENDYQCPCSLCIKDVREYGKCHCSLYLLKKAA
ncbi:MAG: hypothetical protein J6Z11_07325 [Candidatus Riflebacteria bacterium]|nr:hypothetical protein [Candidatus Riflebacteria bacterium]